MEQGRPRPSVPRPAAAGPPAPAAARGEHTHDESEYLYDRYDQAHDRRPRPVRMPQRHSVRGQVLDALRRALADGELAPGEVYSGPALGERFGVSATPVREAMQQLALEGAVEVVPNRGFRVAARDPREPAELAEVRTLLEVPALRRAAAAVPPAHWHGLRPPAEAASAAAAAGDRAAYLEADLALHGALLAPAGNRSLVRVAADLHRRAQWRAPHACLRTDARDHTLLLDALTRGDVEAAVSLWERHLRR
ncbi:GntR family transcriptional regulator [Streptomyces mashuensis]|uniref:GntR family transcriptional regulator n=1 Tax=Streptomyces mashuensis TaxID=33904 RepID=A0A919AVK7_9ACTN|nr:GntR family transcriptional regulator [Streptomyces mashuensis]GHF25616.1 GntR family transcriptional regulator [Streptomyces mashuensis]